MNNDFAYLLVLSFFALLIFLFIFSKNDKIYIFQTNMRLKMMRLKNRGVMPVKTKDEIFEDKIKERVRKMDIKKLIALLNKYKIPYDLGELKKGGFKVRLQFFRLYLAAKSAKKENDAIDIMTAMRRRAEEEREKLEAFDNEAFEKQGQERLKEHMARRNGKPK
jgi:hypothetical protein